MTPTRPASLARALPCALVLLCLCLAPRPASAYLVSQLSAKYLTAESDLVVRGRVAQLSRPDARHMLARIAVDSVLKGDWKSPTLSISYGPPSMFGGVDGLARDEYALFFLSRRGSQLVPRDEQNIEIPIRAGRPALGVEPAEPLERVREELLFTASDPAALEAQAEELRYEPRLSSSFLVLSGSLWAPARAAWQLGELPPEERTIGVLLKLLGSKSRGLKQAAITALLNLGRPEALDAAVELIDAEPEPGVRYPHMMGLAGDWEMFEAIEAYNSLDPDSVAALARMLKHHDAKMRRAAIRALSGGRRMYLYNQERLKNLTGEPGIPYLAQALDDEDVMVRYYAMQGLAHIARIDIRRSPSPGAINNGVAPVAPADEKKYLDFWKQWWLTDAKPAFDAEAAAPK